MFLKFGIFEAESDLDADRGLGMRQIVGGFLVTPGVMLNCVGFLKRGESLVLGELVFLFRKTAIDGFFDNSTILSGCSGDSEVAQWTVAAADSFF